METQFCHSCCTRIKNEYSDVNVLKKTVKQNIVSHMHFPDVCYIFPDDEDIFRSKKRRRTRQDIFESSSEGEGKIDSSFV